MDRGIVFVTGGDRGIGRAIVVRFAKAGFTVCFSYKSNKGAAEETFNYIRSLGSECMYVQMDVSNVNSVLNAFKVLSNKLPYLNVLVNNAGIVSRSNFRDLTLKEWEDVIRVDLTGPFIVTKTFLPLLERAPWASIVNISSVAGQTGHTSTSVAYCAAKAGLIGFTMRLAIELAPKIRVNAVAPTFVETDMIKDVISDPRRREEIIKLHPLRDIAKPEDIAEAVYFLATNQSRFITGQVLSVNGGRLICY